jgi:methylthioribulose-1-phosphate dehydratase
LTLELLQLSQTTEVIATSAALYRRGWIEGTAGNVSVRQSDRPDVALITASGHSKGELVAQDIIPVAVADSALMYRGAPQPSAETQIHTALYRSFPECGAVIHAHPPYATVIAGRAGKAGESAVSLADFELIKGFGLQNPVSADVPVFANWPEVGQIAADIEAHFATPPADAPAVLLIAHHGATAWGPTLEAARNRLECLEGICRLQLLTLAMPLQADGPQRVSA